MKRSGACFMHTGVSGNQQLRCPCLAQWIGEESAPLSDSRLRGEITDLLQIYYSEDFSVCDSRIRRCRMHE